jgi:hypothetical protein
VSSTPAVPPFVPPSEPDPERSAADDIEAEVDVVSRINDPKHDDVFEHLRRKPESENGA